MVLRIAPRVIKLYMGGVLIVRMPGNLESSLQYFTLYLPKGISTYAYTPYMDRSRETNRGSCLPCIHLILLLLLIIECVVSTPALIW